MKTADLLAQLNKLGKTWSEVQKNLDAMGFIAMSDKLCNLKALPKTLRSLMPSYISRSCNCPVALYIHAVTPLCAQASVCDEYVTVRFIGADEPLSVSPPSAVAQFIRRDDARLSKLATAAANAW